MNNFEAILPLKEFLLKIWRTGSVWNVNNIFGLFTTHSFTKLYPQANNSTSIICIRVDFNLGNSNCITNFNQEATNKGINMVTKMMAMVITTMGEFNRSFWKFDKIVCILLILRQKIFKKIAWIQSHHLLWKFKLWAGKFALLPQVNIPTNNLNFHWRCKWLDWIQSIFLNIFYFIG